MRKDFSQPFDAKPSRVYIIAQDATSKTFVLLRSPDEDEEEFCGLLNFVLDTSPLASELAKYLYTHGFDVLSFYELVRETAVEYSFADDTQGSITDTICVHAMVNRTKDLKSIIESQLLDWVGLDRLFSDMQASPYISRAIELGLARLYNEENVI